MSWITGAFLLVGAGVLGLAYWLGARSGRRIAELKFEKEKAEINEHHQKSIETFVKDLNKFVSENDDLKEKAEKIFARSPRVADVVELLDRARGDSKGAKN